MPSFPLSFCGRRTRCRRPSPFLDPSPLDVNSSSVAVSSCCLAVTNDRKLDLGSRRRSGDLVAKNVCVLDLLAVDRGDDVAALYAGLFGGAAGLYVADQNAGRIL